MASAHITPVQESSATAPCLETKRSLCSAQFFFQNVIVLFYLAVPGLGCRTGFQLPHGRSSLTRDQTWAPALGVPSLNHWAAREVLVPGSESGRPCPLHHNLSEGLSQATWQFPRLDPCLAGHIPSYSQQGEKGGYHKCAPVGRTALSSAVHLFPSWGAKGHSFFHGRISSVQLLRCVWFFAAPWTVAHQASLSITNSRSMLKLMSTESVMPFNHLILCCPLLLLPSIFPSIGVFSSESVLHTRWPKYWSFLEGY